ncbi:Ribosomal RNA small subunit methyltransferase H [Candidatus Tremblaya princeps]|uniref:Ribosomal RNA small subunit methyltransferase H n=1 Tax=Tremblaya princeps TaxID=189385 RepID=A0A143WP97_TREPR|nr:Ribosomal RNA small subunit methyltransferase H [Candidatus Tremblaya princeps]
MRIEHHSVMMQEVVDNLLTNTSGLYVDATYGAGGHSTALLGCLGPKARVIALDCDQSIRFARTSDPRAAAGHANFRELDWYLRCAKIYGADGILADLGASATQIHDEQRGLSYLHPGPLDMRVDPTRSAPLSGRISRTELGTLHSSLRCHGLYGRTKAAASSILHIVRQARYATTLDVATASCCLHSQSMHIVADAFRALRSMANSEPQCLKALVHQAPAVLKPGGRLLILTFDSYGERLVKASIEHANSLILLRTIAPTQREVATNAGARSSLLHVLRSTGNPRSAAP